MKLTTLLKNLMILLGQTNITIFTMMEKILVQILCFGKVVKRGFTEWKYSIVIVVFADVLVVFLVLDDKFSESFGIIL